MSAMQSRAIRGLWALSSGLLMGTAACAAIPIEHWVQPSGAQVFLVRSPSIPMVDVRMEFDAGDRRDPAGKAGLATAMAASLSNGVQATPHERAMDENALGEAWADAGAVFAASASEDRLSFSLRSLTEPELLNKAVTLAARQIAQPAFPAAIWQRDRLKWIAALKEADTRPATQAAHAFAHAVFGTHPYGAEISEASLMRMQVQDMAALHARAVRPCYAKVSVVGALERAQVDALVAQLLARLPASTCPALPSIPEVPPLAGAQEQDLPFPSAQAQVLLGQPGYARRDPDHLALTVGNFILGGSASSRLMQEVREKRGLSYGVDSGFAPGLHAGAFTLSLQTRPDQARRALRLARDVLAAFVAQGPTEAELQAAKDHLIGSFPLLLDGNQKLLENVANIAWNGLPLDYLDTWTAQIQQLTVADIRAAFARKIQPERMVTVVLGAANAAPSGAATPSVR